MRLPPMLAALLLISAPAGAADVVVTEAGQKFDHEAVTIRAGDALVVTNADNANHALKLSAEDDDPQDLGVQKPGQVLRVNFPNAGSYRLRCSITPDMLMKVFVN